MTQTTFTDNVLVDGSQDIKQLRVQGHTTQLQPVQTWEDSAGGTLAQLTGDGRLIVGDDVTPESLVEAHRLETSTSKPKRGLHSLGQVSGTLATLVQWIVGELELRGSAAIDALHTTLRIRADAALPLWIVSVFGFDRANRIERLSVGAIEPKFWANFCNLIGLPQWAAEQTNDDLKDQIRAEVERTLTAYGTPSAGSGHVFNLGHGISQFTPPEAVSAMVEAVHSFSRKQRV